MSKQVTIEVTQEDIDNGKPEDCSFCAIALAIRRQLHVDTVSVDVTSISWANGGSYKVPKVPQAAIDFINAFDHYEYEEYVDEHGDLDEAVVHPKNVKPASFIFEAEQVGQ